MNAVDNGVLMGIKLHWRGPSRLFCNEAGDWQAGTCCCFQPELIFEEGAPGRNCLLPSTTYHARRIQCELPEYYLYLHTQMA